MTFLLYESAAGYALFSVTESALSVDTFQVAHQKQIREYNSFRDMVKLVALAPFETPEHSLQNINSVSEGVMHEFLDSFLKNMLKGKSNARLGLLDTVLGRSIQEGHSVTCFTDNKVQELLRGVRLHFSKFIKELDEKDLYRAQLGLGHAYSRAKVKFNVNKADNMIIQSIAMIDQLDKDLNTFVMRLREWYSWHFPELNKLVKDSNQYVKLVLLIMDKESIGDKAEAVKEIVQDEELADTVVEGAQSSLGTSLNEFDMANIEMFANRVKSLQEYRASLYEYLKDQMKSVAPNLHALIGEQVGARLISHAGSLTNLAKQAASTVQILGAEKALFRALKSHGKTPKYGLLYHSTFIGQAQSRDKGRISRYLANKCSLASRIDAFTDFPTSKYGEAMRDQVQRRLDFYTNNPGEKLEIEENAEIYAKIQQEVEAENKKSTGQVKRKRVETADTADETEPPKKKQKKEKKKKKSKKEKKKKKGKKKKKKN